jgi:hypothetical protein
MESWRSALHLHVIAYESVPWLRQLLLSPLPLLLDVDAIELVFANLELCDLLSLAASCTSLRRRVRQSMITQGPHFFVVRQIGHPCSDLLDRLRPPNAHYGLSDASLLNPRHAVRCGSGTLVSMSFESRYGGRQMLRLLPDGDGKPTDFDDNVKALPPAARLKVEHPDLLAVGARHVFVLEAHGPTDRERSLVQVRDRDSGELLGRALPETDDQSISPLLAVAALEELLFVLIKHTRGALVQIWDRLDDRHRWSSGPRYQFVAATPGRLAVGLTACRHEGCTLCAILTSRPPVHAAGDGNAVVCVFDVSDLIMSPPGEAQPVSASLGSSRVVFVREFPTTPPDPKGSPPLTPGSAAKSDGRSAVGLGADAVGILYVTESVLADESRLPVDGEMLQMGCLKAFSLRTGRLLARHALKEPGRISVDARSRVLLTQAKADCVLEIGLRLRDSPGCVQ